MSRYIAYVGEVIIKEEHREGFGQLFRNEYAYDYGIKIEDNIISDYVRTYEGLFLEFAHWNHFDYKDEWKGKYQTAYDEVTGHFVYGVAYNMHGLWNFPMSEFFCELLPEITERIILEDNWVEPC